MDALSAARSDLQTSRWANPCGSGSRSRAAEREEDSLSEEGLQSRGAHNHAAVVETLSVRQSYSLLCAGRTRAGLEDRGAEHEADRHRSAGSRSSFLQDARIFVGLLRGQSTLTPLAARQVPNAWRTRRSDTEAFGAEFAATTWSRTAKAGCRCEPSGIIERLMLARCCEHPVILTFSTDEEMKGAGKGLGTIDDTLAGDAPEARESARPGNPALSITEEGIASASQQDMAESGWDALDAVDAAMPSSHSGENRSMEMTRWLGSGHGHGTPGFRAELPLAGCRTGAKYRSASGTAIANQCEKKAKGRWRSRYWRGGTPVEDTG